MNSSSLAKQAVVSLAAVNQIYVIHEVMNGCKISRDSLKACFGNVNIRMCVIKGLHII